MHINKSTRSDIVQSFTEPLTNIMFEIEDSLVAEGEESCERNDKTQLRKIIERFVNETIDHYFER